MDQSNNHDEINTLINQHRQLFDVKSPVHVEHKAKKHAPKYIIVIKDIFDDLHYGYKNAGLCYGFQASIYKMPNESFLNAVHLKSGKLIKKDVITCIPVGRWGASLQSHMVENKVIPEISIIRVEHSDEFDTTIQKTDFHICSITTYDQIDDKLIFSFTYESKTDDYTDYTHDGVKRGHAAYTIKPDDTIKKLSTDGPPPFKV